MLHLLIELGRPDNVGATIDWDKASNPNVKYPNTFTWKCDFKTTDGKTATGNDNKEHINAFETVEDVEQTFTMAERSSGSGLKMNTKISKFSKKRCSVERTSTMPQYYYTDDDQ